jgi:hypothetical protein
MIKNHPLPRGLNLKEVILIELSKPSKSVRDFYSLLIHFIERDQICKLIDLYKTRTYDEEINGVEELGGKYLSMMTLNHFL